MNILDLIFCRTLFLKNLPMPPPLPGGEDEPRDGESKAFNSNLELQHHYS